MEAYEHKAQYYETDQMWVDHHSIYIRWYESARLHFMEMLGLGYKQMEEEGIISPVVSVHSEYKSMVSFDDVVKIIVKIKKYSGVRLELEYIIKDKKTGETVNTGWSCHCFIKDGKIVNLKKVAKNFHKMFENALLSQDDTEK